MIVIIDNYDSFTYNLVQYYRKLDNHVIVYRNDEVTYRHILQLNPNLIVFSPGPGTPKESGVCTDILEHALGKIPIFGVCLGFQLIVDFFGGSIIKGVCPVHGKISKVTHTNKGIFQHIPSPTEVTRYHSLVANDKDIPTNLEITSYAEDNVIMGIRHKQFPVEGIQFHPESILTQHGFKMIENSYNQALEWSAQKEGVKI